MSRPSTLSGTDLWILDLSLGNEGASWIEVALSKTDGSSEDIGLSGIELVGCFKGQYSVQADLTKTYTHNTITYFNFEPPVCIC